MAERAVNRKEADDFTLSHLPDNNNMKYSERTLPPQLPGTPPVYELEKHGAVAQSSPRLNAAAEKIGEAIGAARNFPGKIKSRLRIVGGRNKVSGGIVHEPVGPETAASQAAGQKMSEWASAARQPINWARQRASYYGDEYPVQTILVFAGLAFCAGFMLRVWRANSD